MPAEVFLDLIFFSIILWSDFLILDARSACVACTTIRYQDGEGAATHLWPADLCEIRRHHDNLQHCVRFGWSPEEVD